MTPPLPYGFQDGDAFYAALAQALEDGGDDQALSFLTRMVLILANEVGDQDKLERALAAALEP